VQGGDVEWWRTLELGSVQPGTLHFVDRTTAERFARYLVDEGCILVRLERWRGGDRVATEFIDAGSPGSAGPDGLLIP
jgi:hypothetical protein